MIVFLTILFLYLTWFIIRKEPFGLHNPLTIFVYSLFIYKFSSILNVIFFNNSLNYPIGLFQQNLFLVNTFLIGLILTNFSLISKKYNWSVNLLNIQISKVYYFIFYSFLLFGLILYILFLKNAYGSIFSIFLLESRSEQFYLKRGYGIFEFGSYFILIGFTGLFFISLVKYKKIFHKKNLHLIVVFFIYLLFFLLIGERGEILRLTLPIIGALSLFKRIPKKTFYILLPISIFLMQLVSIVRAYPLNTIDIELLLNITKNANLNPAEGGELIASTNVDISLLKDLSNGNLDLKYGATYIESILNLFPDFIVGKQELLSEWYVKTYNLFLYQEGGGLAFSIIGEGIVNFGYYGGLLGGLITGLVFRVITLNMRKLDNPFFNILIGLITISFCFFLQRSGLGNILKIYLFSVIIPLYFLKNFLIRNN